MLSNSDTVVKRLRRADGVLQCRNLTIVSVEARQDKLVVVGDFVHNSTKATH